MGAFPLAWLCVLPCLGNVSPMPNVPACAVRVSYRSFVSAVLSQSKPTTEGILCCGIWRTQPAQITLKDGASMMPAELVDLWGCRQFTNLHQASAASGRCPGDPSELQPHPRRLKALSQRHTRCHDPALLHPWAGWPLLSHSPAACSQGAFTRTKSLCKAWPAGMNMSVAMQPTAGVHSLDTLICAL